MWWDMRCPEKLGCAGMCQEMPRDTGKCCVMPGDAGTLGDTPGIPHPWAEAAASSERLCPHPWNSPPQRCPKSFITKWGWGGQGWIVSLESSRRFLFPFHMKGFVFSSVEIRSHLLSLLLQRQIPHFPWRGRVLLPSTSWAIRKNSRGDPGRSGQGQGTGSP